MNYLCHKHFLFNLSSSDGIETNKSTTIKFKASLIRHFKIPPCQVFLTDSGYSDFNMCVTLGRKITSRMFDLFKKKSLCRGD